MNLKKTGAGGFLEDKYMNNTLSKARLIIDPNKTLPKKQKNRLLGADFKPFQKLLINWTSLLSQRGLTQNRKNKKNIYIYKHQRGSKNLKLPASRLKNEGSKTLIIALGEQMHEVPLDKHMTNG